MTGKAHSRLVKVLPESGPKHWHVFRLLLHQAAHAERSVLMNAGESVRWLPYTVVDLHGEGMTPLK
jgi:hypothetical protein